MVAVEILGMLALAAQIVLAQWSRPRGQPIFMPRVRAVRNARREEG